MKDEKVCLHCDEVVLNLSELVEKSIDGETYNFHKNCVDEWKNLSNFRKRLRIRIYKLGQDTSWSPSYYHGLSYAETECAELFEKMAQSFPSLSIVKREDETEAQFSLRCLKKIEECGVWKMEWLNE